MTYATMCTIGTAALFRCLVDLNMLDDQIARIKAFCIGVCFGIFEETEEKLGGFYGPTCAGDSELFS